MVAITEGALVPTEIPITVATFAETLKLAAYAETGGRKTLQIGHLIETFGAENIGIISCEHGLNTIHSRVDERYVKTAGNLSELRSAWGWANERFNNHDKWVCIDGGTRVLNWVQQEIFSGAQAALEQMINGVNRRDLPADIRKFAPYVTKEMDLNTQQMWIKTGFECERILDTFVRLGANMYWTFWEDRTSLDQYTKGPPMIPDTPGKGALNAVKGTFDFIFRLVSTGENVTAYFRNPVGSNMYYGKTRDDWAGGVKVPDSISNFNLAKFVQLVKGEIKLDV